MRKTPIIFFLVAVMAACVFAGAAVYQRSIVKIGKATGAAVWTNDMRNVSRQGAIKLQKLWVIGDLVAADTVTVTRVASETFRTNNVTTGYTNSVQVVQWYTQAVCTISVAANAGNTNVFSEPYLTLGDTLVFSATSGTGSTVMVEYEVQTY